MLKKDYQDQRDHLGAHLKNSVSKVYQITDGILQICQYARKGKLGKGRSFKEIEKLALELRHWNDVEWKKEKVESNKFMLSKDDADNKIYPTLKDIKNVLAT